MTENRLTECIYSILSKPLQKDEQKCQKKSAVNQPWYTLKKMWSIFNVAVFDVVHCVQKLSGSKVALNINKGIILDIQNWLEKSC